MESITDAVKSLLDDVNAEKAGERSEQQRKIAILATKLEDVLAWAKHTYGS